MCGIAGIYHYRAAERPVDRELLTAMTNTLAHRGPDGQGVWLQGPVGLGHRRLAIIDPSAASAQPMLDDSGQSAISFNGEIYNFRELRAELERRGHRFCSTGDTEVVLKAYRQWGAGIVERLSGIYAFAIWDGENRKLFLARDAIGVKPLFYADDGLSFRFASEMKAILRDPGVGRDLNPEALDAFLTFGYTAAPTTGVKAIEQLLPGHYAIVGAGGIETTRYWSPPYGPKPRDIAFGAALDELRERLDRVTESQMVSDVGIGAFLSGGIDSAAVVAAMTRAGGGRVRAFGAGMDWAEFNELAGARSTAAELGVDLAEIELGAADAGIVPAISLHLEEPTADSSAIPMYLLSQRARTELKVVMSGDGADEILAGYDTYRAARLARAYRRVPAALRRGLAEPMARAIPQTRAKYPLADVARRFVHAAELGPGRDHSAWRIIFNSENKGELYASGFLEASRAFDPLARYAAYIDEVPGSRTPLEGLLHADTSFYLPNDMLVKVDRMSMAHGLEVRVPFLDPDLVAFCAGLPSEFKLKNGRIRKHILREAMRGTLPRQILEAPKSGFNIPVDAWMRGSLFELLLDAVATSRDELGRFLNVGAVIDLAEKHRRGKRHVGHILYVTLMFALWLQNLATCWKPGPTQAPAATSAV